MNVLKGIHGTVSSAASGLASIGVGTAKGAAKLAGGLGLGWPDSISDSFEVMGEVIGMRQNCCQQEIPKYFAFPEVYKEFKEDADEDFKTPVALLLGLVYCAKSGEGKEENSEEEQCVSGDESELSELEAHRRLGAYALDVYVSSLEFTKSRQAKALGLQKV